jgi:predicted ATPase/transcriptional regulator with XRE-family HTH domain
MGSEYSTFGQWVKTKRKERGLTQKALGLQVGYAEITVRQIEKDTYNLTRFVTERFVTCLATDVDEASAIIGFALKQASAASTTTAHSINYHSATPFIGRQSEIKQIADLLRNPNCRCISIVGVGGIGKTRLAVQCLSAISDSAFQHSVFVDLSEATIIEQAARMIAVAVGIIITPFTTVVSQILHALTSRNMLLVLDNFEQLLPEGVGFLSAVLEHSPRTKMIITSRERLQIRGEWSIRLQGLGMTDTSPPTDAQELFINTAQRINDQFLSTETEMIHAICRLLQGIPLAIEMAATWTNVHTCAEILNGVTNNALDLTSRYQDIDKRHKSLQTIFETTWKRLSLHEQEALMRLAVFRGGFTLVAAQKVASADKTTLAFLQEKMLIHPLSEGRLVLHEMIRQLALQKLMLDEEEWRDTHTVHAEYFVQLFSTSADRIKYISAREAISHINREIENMRVAWNTLLEQHRTDWFDQCWESMWLFFNVTSRFREGEDWFSAVIDAFAASSVNTNVNHTADFNRVLVANFLLRQGRIPESYAFISNSQLETVRHSVKVRERYLFYFVESYVFHALGNSQAALVSGEAGLQDAIFMEKDPYFLITGYYQMGRVHHLLGNSETAHQYLSSALQLYRENKLGWGMGLVLTELGLVAETMGRINEALAYYEAVLDAVNDWEEVWNYYRTRISIGRVKLALGQTREAIAILYATLRDSQINPHIGLEIDCFVEIAIILKLFGDISWAILLLEYCSKHPECFQPVRDRAADYLKKLTAEVPDQTVSVARNLFPANKSDVTVYLLARLEQFTQR